MIEYQIPLHDAAAQGICACPRCKRAPVLYRSQGYASTERAGADITRYRIECSACIIATARVATIDAARSAWRNLIIKRLYTDQSGARAQSARATA
jgi:hypothetical protein